jgi:hypothetical protein
MRSEAQNNTGAIQPVTTVAAALPADPSRATTPVRIHHHGSEASTLATAASKLRTSCFMKLPHHTAGSIALALLLWRGSN